MKKTRVQICVVCFGVLVNGEMHNDHDTITKLILTSRYFPNQVDVEKYVCLQCAKFLTDEEQTKRIKEG
jgi:hypothetical protein